MEIPQLSPIIITDYNQLLLITGSTKEAKRIGTMANLRKEMEEENGEDE